MAVTNYICMGGEILAETTGNSVVVYHCDALGSVRLTTDGSGSVLNSYLYKPFGSLLLKGGIAPDPLFTWMGAGGYRVTGVPHASVYVSPRCYDPISGRWTTINHDSGGLEPYTYVGNSPTNGTTFIGFSSNEISWVRVTDLYYTNAAECGGFQYGICFKPPRNSRGWIVQHVVTNYDYFRCRDAEWAYPPACSAAGSVLGFEEFWEAWYFDGKKVIDCDTNYYSDDNFTQTSFCKCSWGGVEIDGYVKFRQDLPIGMVPSSVKCAYCLNASWTKPPDHTDEGAKLHFAYSNYACCGSKDPNSCQGCCGTGFFASVTTDTGTIPPTYSPKCSDWKICSL